MDKHTLIDSESLAETVIGATALKTIEDWSGAAKRTANKRGEMADSCHAEGIVSAYCKAPKKPDRETVVTLASGDHTLQQVYDSLKVAIAAGRGKADLDLYLAVPDELPSNRKPLRNKLLRNISAGLGDLGKALTGREEQAQLDKLQEAEDEAAKQEGREPNLLTKAVLSPTRPDEDRIAEAVVKIVKICTGSEEPDYDATAIAKHARAIFGMIGKVDPTIEV